MTGAGEVTFKRPPFPSALRTQDGTLHTQGPLDKPTLQTRMAKETGRLRWATCRPLCWNFEEREARKRRRRRTRTRRRTRRRGRVDSRPWLEATSLGCERITSVRRVQLYSSIKGRSQRRERRKTTTPRRPCLRSSISTTKTNISVSPFTVSYQRGENEKGSKSRGGNKSGEKQ